MCILHNDIWKIIYCIVIFTGKNCILRICMYLFVFIKEKIVEILYKIYFAFLSKK